MWSALIDFARYGGWDRFLFSPAANRASAAPSPWRSCSARERTDERRCGGAEVRSERCFTWQGHLGAEFLFGGSRDGIAAADAPASFDCVHRACGARRATDERAETSAGGLLPGLSRTTRCRRRCREPIRFRDHSLKRSAGGRASQPIHYLLRGCRCPASRAVPDCLACVALRTRAGPPRRRASRCRTAVGGPATGHGASGSTLIRRTPATATRHMRLPPSDPSTPAVLFEYLDAVQARTRAGIRLWRRRYRAGRRKRGSLNGDGLGDVDLAPRSPARQPSCAGFARRCRRFGGGCPDGRPPSGTAPTSANRRGMGVQTLDRSLPEADPLSL